MDYPDEGKSADESENDDLTYREAAILMGCSEYKVGSEMHENKAFALAVKSPRWNRIKEGPLREWIATHERPKLRHPGRPTNNPDQQLAVDPRGRSNRTKERELAPVSWSQIAGLQHDVLTPEEVSAVLRLALPDVIAGLASGDIPGGLRIGNHWRIVRKDFDQLLGI